MAKKKVNAEPAEEVKEVQPKEEQPKEAPKPVFDAPLVDLIKIHQFKRNNPRMYKLLIDEYEATKGGAQ